MASLTVRQLDDKLKTLLRLRAARHGRSMEDEVRVILREAAGGTGRNVLEQFDPPAQPARHKTRAAATAVRAFFSSSAAALPLTNRLISSGA